MTTTRKAPRTSPGRRSSPSDWKVLNGTDHVRWTRVQVAQARIASGFYEREEVQAAVAAAVLREIRRH